MTECNDTEIKVYDQLMKVRMCVDAFKDIYENIPDDDRYASVLRIIGDRIDLEFAALMPVVLGNIKNE